MAQTEPVGGSLTAAEIIAYPEFPHITWDLKPREKSTVVVAKDRTFNGGPVTISYEIHGNGPIKLVWVMGLGALKSSWQRQTKDFAHTQASKYTCLVFDNRGMGESSKPLRRYSTSDMALDAIELLNHLGWTQQRGYHFVGVSMGGMICQELAMRIPTRMASLSLISTAAAIKNTIGFIENLRNRINMFIPRSIDEQMTRTKHNLWTEKWLTLPDSHEYTIKPFPTNGDFVMAAEIKKRVFLKDQFVPRGFMLQAIAAGWHHKSAAQLRQIADTVGPERIIVAHGKEDRMITYPHAPVLLEGLGWREGQEGGIKTYLLEGEGHMLPAELRREFNGWIEEIVAKGEELNRREGIGANL